MTDIADYPELKEALAEVINVPYDNLQSFNTCTLDVFKRDSLIAAYKLDADEDEIESVLDIESIAKVVKKGLSADIAVNDSILERIYDIAQEMEPYLRELERVNNEKDRINE